MKGRFDGEGYLKLGKKCFPKLQGEFDECVSWRNSPKVEKVVHQLNQMTVAGEGGGRGRAHWSGKLKKKITDREGLK